MINNKDDSDADVDDADDMYDGYSDVSGTEGCGEGSGVDLVDRIASRQ